VDDTPVVCICYKLSNPKVLAGTGESAGDVMGISRCFGSAHSFQLASYTEAGVGSGWSSNHSQHIMVVDCDCTVAVHFHHKIRWSMEWIHMASICGLVWFCEAFSGFSCYVMVFYFH